MLDDQLSAMLGGIKWNGQANQMIVCPFHDDRHPSLSISLEKGVWWCFACGKGGGLQRLAQMLGGNLDAADLAVRTLDLEPAKPEADFTDLAVQQESDLYDLLSDVKVPEWVWNYFEKRGISREAMDMFHMGFDLKRNALTFPYWDADRVRSIQYRYADGSKNQETGGKRLLYNVNDVRGQPEVIVCEGESDTQRVWSALPEDSTIRVCGVPGAASGNRRWSLWGIDLMWAERIWIAFDADEAGDKGAEVAIKELGDKATRLRPEGGKDWCEPGVNWEWLDEIT